MALHAEPAIVPDKWNDDRYRYIPALRGEDFASMVSVPMMIPRGRRVVGVLNLHSREPRNFGPYDLALLTQVANLMARTIENSRLYHRLAQREEMLETFATRIIEAQEQERRRLAGDIHDGISQRLVSLWYHLLAAEISGLGSGDGRGGSSGRPRSWPPPPSRRPGGRSAACAPPCSTTSAWPRASTAWPAPSRWTRSPSTSSR